MVKLPPLPEPAFRRLSDLQSGIDDWYSPSQMQAHYQKGRADALENAASICDDLHHAWRFGDGEDSTSGPMDCANKIRSLK